MVNPTPGAGQVYMTTKRDSEGHTLRADKNYRLESNHMKTASDDGWFVYFRLYAPLQPFFDKTFKLPDFEVID